MTGLFAFVEDLLAEGVGESVRRVRSYGVNDLILALNYHAARDVAPHTPGRVVARRAGLRFVPADGAFAGLAPEVAIGGADQVGELMAEARMVGLEPVGWVVFLHQEPLGWARPELTQENCFGARASMADLCPAQHEVRRYCVDLAVAAVETGVRRIVAEALNYGTFGHGYHHERSFVSLDGMTQFLLGLCFCPACAAAAPGVDVATARARACEVVDRVMGGEPGPGDEVTAAALTRISPELAGFARARVDVVSTLVAEVSREVAARGARLTVIDPAGAMQGYGDGRPGPESGADITWQVGLDPAAVSEHADYALLLYAAGPDRVRAETARYRAEIASSAELTVVLRPGWPDCADADNLAAKVSGARVAGAADVAFYHDSLARLGDLARVRGAAGV